MFRIISRTVIIIIIIILFYFSSSIEVTVRYLMPAPFS